MCSLYRAQCNSNDSTADLDCGMLSHSKLAHLQRCSGTGWRGGRSRIKDQYCYFLHFDNNLRQFALPVILPAFPLSWEMLGKCVHVSLWAYIQHITHQHTHVYCVWLCQSESVGCGLVGVAAGSSLWGIKYIRTYVHRYVGTSNRSEAQRLPCMCFSIAVWSRTIS